jgi:FAD:protein FMN transferase
MTSVARTSALEGNRRARWLLPLFLVLLAILSWQRLANSPDAGTDLELSGRVMGTTWSVRVAAPVADGSSRVAEELEELIQAQFDAVDLAMSTYRADSELSLFNAHVSTEPFAVSSDTLEVFRIAAEVSESSQGALDVTVGPLVALWGFGAGARIPTEPDPAELANIAARVGWRRIRIDVESGALSKTHAQTRADLSAVAKGYAVDRVADALLERGVSQFLVELGGELRAAGRRSDGHPWRVGVERPDTEGRSLLEVVELEDAGLATSGDYRIYYEADGVRRSHLLDPRTARPIEHGLASASVIHASATHADAWATALSILGPQDGWRVAEELGLAVHFVLRQADGGFAVRATPSFAERIRTAP